MNVGENIRKYRKEKGLTQSELAHKTSLALSTIQRYEKGHRQPTMQVLQKIADALGIPVYRLTFNDEESLKAIEKAENILKNFKFVPNDDSEKALNCFKYLLDYLFINWRQNSTDENLINIMNGKMLHDFLTNMLILYNNDTNSNRDI